MSSYKDAKDKGLSPLVHKDHPAPVTRRQLMAQGFLGSAAYSLLPTLGSLLAGNAWADTNCGDDAGVASIPFLVFDLAGGAGLPGNFLVGKQGGPEDLLASYDQLGWDPRAAGALDRSFGLPMSALFSKMLVGMKQTASAAALANLRMGSFCHFSQDDSSANQLSPITLMSKAGSRGLYLPKGLGTRDSASGGNSNVIFNEPTLKPLNVTRIEDLLGAVSFGQAFQALGGNEMTRLAQGTLQLSLGQVAALPPSAQKQLLADLSACGYRKNVAYTQGVTGLDPRGDTNFQQIYNINQNSAPNDPNVVNASVTMNALKGQSGPGVLTFSGCDYHTGSQGPGDAKDLEIGLELGRAIEGAKRLGKPLFFQILTDGGVGAKQGTREWQNDQGIKGMTVIGYYRPDQAPAMTDVLQVGQYTDGQGVDRNSFIGADANKVAYAVFANYLQISGRLGEFDNYVPTGVFTPEQLRKTLIFA